MPQRDHTGLDLVRAAMVLSGLAPLFLLWSIRGIEGVPDSALWGICGVLVVFPTGLLVTRWLIAKRQKDIRTFDVGEVQNHRDHAVVYLLAMVLPLYDVNLGTVRQTFAMIAALCLVAFLFFHLRLHYVNLIFAMRGYSAYSWSTPDGPIVVLSQAGALHRGDRITCYRLGGSVYVEGGKS